MKLSVIVNFHDIEVFLKGDVLNVIFLLIFPIYYLLYKNMKFSEKHHEYPSPFV